MSLTKSLSITSRISLVKKGKRQEKIVLTEDLPGTDRCFLWKHKSTGTTPSSSPVIWVENVKTEKSIFSLLKRAFLREPHFVFVDSSESSVREQKKYPKKKQPYSAETHYYINIKEAFFVTQRPLQRSPSILPDEQDVEATARGMLAHFP